MLLKSGFRLLRNGLYALGILFEGLLVYLRRLQMLLPFCNTDTRLLLLSLFSDGLSCALSFERYSTAVNLLFAVFGVCSRSFVSVDFAKVC